MVTYRAFRIVFVSIFFARTIAKCVFLKNLTIAIFKVFGRYNYTFITHFITQYKPVSKGRLARSKLISHIIAHA